MTENSLKTLIGLNGKSPEHIDLNEYGAVVVCGGDNSTRASLLENIRFRKPVLMRRFNAMDNNNREELEEAVFPCYGVNISWGKESNARHVEEFHPDGIR
ncbi:MAG: hypothetical protein MJY56_02820 [Bacteroidales bacterium]|nr:hypothetical protein [Bacteroidales bacterium]